MTDQGPPPSPGDEPTSRPPGAPPEPGGEDSTLEMPEVPGSGGPDDATLIQPPVPPVDPTLVQGRVPPPPPSPPGPPPPAQTPWWRRGWAIAFWVVLAALLAFGVFRLTDADDEPDVVPTSTSSTAATTSTGPADSSTSTSSTSSTVAPSTTTTTPPTTTTAAPSTTTTQPPPEALFSDGTHLVGVDIDSGTYETGLLPTVEPGEDPNCSWQRLSGTDGTEEEIIAGADVDTHGIVDVLDTDIALVTSGCGDWYPLTALTVPMNDIPPGTWAVGPHIAAGRYAAPGGDECSWARLSAFTGEDDAVVDQDTVDGSVIVDVADTDAGFASRGCGAFTPTG